MYDDGTDWIRKHKHLSRSQIISKEWWEFRKDLFYICPTGWKAITCMYSPLWCRRIEISVPVRHRLGCDSQVQNIRERETGCAGLTCPLLHTPLREEIR